MSNKPLPVLLTLTLKCALVCLVCTNLVHAQTTINVPADQPTIQTAINAANNGDTVVVAPGTYIENLDFLGKAITVTSSDGPSLTIVDGNAAGPVATFKTNEGVNSVLNGFTLRNGVPSQAIPSDGMSGAGVWIYYSSPTITNNFIVSNHSICGIGMKIQGGSAMVRGNTISDNTQAGATGNCGGGGIDVTGDSSHPSATPQIIGNTIMKNDLSGGGYGAGIAVESFASPLIENNDIVGNTAYNSGGGIFLQSSGTPVVVQNIILNNNSRAGGSGGGIAVFSAATVVNNTIVQNSTFDGSSGIFADGVSQFTISNNIVVAASGQIGIVCSLLSSSLPVFSHNDVTSSGGQAWSTTCASFASTNGNISADPLFATSTTVDFHLQATSPAIDAGDDTAPNIPQQDYDGNPRIVVGNATTGSATVDMGAYEFVPTAAPAATLSPTSLTFGNQVVNTTGTAQTVTLSNTGTAGLTVSGIFTSGDFSQSNTCPATLNAGSSCDIQITFQPTAAGERSGLLTVSNNSVPAPPAVVLTGTGMQPAISVSPASISFGNQSINTSAADQTITVTNTGSATLHVSSTLVSGSPGLNVILNNCSGGVPPAGSCTVEVGFTPPSAGPASATLTIGSDASNGPVSVSLSGTGVNPVIATVSASVLNFGNQAVGTQSPTQTISLTNTGTGGITVSGVTLAGDPDFILVDNGCAGGFAAGITCPIRIAFAPKLLGTGSATLTITSNASNNPVSVALSGTGVNPPTASVSPTTISFGNQPIGADSPVQTVTVTNTGGTTLHVNSLTMSGDADFFIVINSCVNGTGVAPGDSCTIQMEFQPKNAGPGSATLTIGSDAANGPVAVSTTGTGVQPAMVSISPSGLNFGNQNVGTQSQPQTVTVTNTGSLALHVSSLVPGGDADFSVLSSNCVGIAVAPGGTCAIQMVFAPKSAGSGLATLNINSDAGNNPVGFASLGTGVNPPKASVSPVSLNFGSLLVGTQSAAQAVTISNTGGVTLHVSSLAITGDPDFSTPTNNCVGATGVAPGGRCSIQVVFFPHSGGSGAASLVIGSDDPAAPQQSVSLTGTGIDYAVSAPVSLSVRSGDKAQPTITVSAVGGNFSSPVALSCSGLPTGASCSFSPASVVPGAGSATSRLTINTQQSGGIKTPLGTYTMVVNGTSGGSVHTAPITLTVTR